MALKWSQVMIAVTVDDDSGKSRTETHRGPAARAWVASHFTDAPVDSDAGKELVILNGPSGKLANQKALDYLIDLFKPKPSSGERRVAITTDTGYVTWSQDFGPIRRGEVNTLQPARVFKIELRLGDIDALFEPLGGGAPETQKGVRERLQALGYLYAPMGHPDLAPFASKGWNYFARVHSGAGARKQDPELLDILKREIKGNLLTGTRLLESARVNPDSVLPARGASAVIRFPGAYRVTSPRLAALGPGGGGEYDFRIGGRRDLAAALLFRDSPVLGAFPLIATVTELLRDGASKPAPDMYVYFQLVPPEAVPGELVAAGLSETVMNYGNDPSAIERILVTPLKNDKGTPTTEEWLAAKREAQRIAVAVENKPEIQEARRLENEAVADLDSRSAAIRKRLAEAKIRTQDANAKKAAYFSKETADANKAQLAAKDRLDQTPNPATVAKTLRSAKSNLDIAKSRQEKKEAGLRDARSLGAEVYDAKAMQQFEGELRAAEQGVAEQQAIYDVAFRNSETVKAGPDEAKRVYDGAAANLRDKEEAYSQRNAEIERTNPFNEEARLATEEEARIAAEVKKFDDEIKERHTQANQEVFKQQQLLAGPVVASAGTPEEQRKAAAVVAILKKAETDGPVAKVLKSDPAAPGAVNVGAQKAFVKKVLEDAEKILGGKDPADPQRKNAPSDYGGKAGLPVAGNIFDLKSMPRFTDGHKAWGALPVAEAVDAKLYAVKAKTNTQGHAGVIFRPSHLGGEMYRIKAYIGSESLPKNAVSPSQETGTMVVWRNIRLGRWRRHAPNVANLGPRITELMTEADAVQKAPAPHPNWKDLMTVKAVLTDSPPVLALSATDALEPAYPPNNVMRLTNPNLFRPVAHQYISLAENFRRGYCDLIVDFSQPESFNQGELDQALRAMTAAIDAANALPFRVHWDSLLFADVTSPYLVNMRHFLAYNNRLVAGRSNPDTQAEFAVYPDLSKEEAAKVANPGIFNYGVQPIAEVLMDGGLDPGLTILQFPHGDPWDGQGFDICGAFTSGWAMAPAGCLLFYTDGRHREKMCYSGSSNAAHELGHHLMLPHQPPFPSGDPHAHEPAAGTLQTPKAGETNCVMSYKGSFGEYCGRCGMSLRGWHTRRTLFADANMTTEIGVDEAGV